MGNLSIHNFFTFQNVDIRIIQEKLVKLLKERRPLKKQNEQFQKPPHKNPNMYDTMNWCESAKTIKINLFTPCYNFINRKLQRLLWRSKVILQKDKSKKSWNIVISCNTNTYLYYSDTQSGIFLQAHMAKSIKHLVAICQYPETAVAILGLCKDLFIILISA